MTAAPTALSTERPRLRRATISDLWFAAMVIAGLGSLAPELRAAIAGSFQVLIVPWKILAMVGPSSLRLLTPDRL